MQRVYYEPSYSDHNNVAYRLEISQRQEDTEHVACVLLALKHRSVTPEPPHPCDESSSQHSLSKPHRGSYQSYSYATYAYSQATRQEKGPAPVEQVSHENVASDVPWETLLDGSKLVSMGDRDLVPDALFVAMAQMKHCRLTQADRVGCYKSREIGFVGMCCKHCGGQPGFGRFYPNSVRSLAQTTTSQTILKHIGNKCRFCPAHIRNAVLELQRTQAEREGLASSRPRYGSRKVFFQRVWSRLHGSKDVDDDDCKDTDDVSTRTPSDTDEETSMNSGLTGEFDELERPDKRKAEYDQHVNVPRKRSKRTLVSSDDSRSDY